MAFDMLDKLKQVKETVADFGMEKTQEALVELNLLLGLLQNTAGYEVSKLDIELSVPATVTIDLKASPTLNEDKLNAILRDNQDKKVVAAIVAALIQANRLRSGVTVETLELKEIKIVLTTVPKITLQWKAKAAASA